MTISDGMDTKNLTLYPPARPSLEVDTSLWIEQEEEEEEVQPLLTIGRALTFKNETEDDTISNFISEPTSVNREVYQILNTTLGKGEQENLTEEALVGGTNMIPVVKNSESIPVEVEPGRTLNINPGLSSEEQTRLIQLLKEHKGAFAWEYTDMRGIPSNLCTHHIYIKSDSRPVCQPQRRMNPNLRDIVKEEIQKLLEAGFIYPISDSEWVSPLVIVPKKNGKWRVCVDYRELNKATQKDHFPLPFIDQVLDTLSGKKFFSFLDGFSGYNQIQIAPEDQDKTTFTCPWGTFA